MERFGIARRRTGVGLRLGAATALLGLWLAPAAFANQPAVAKPEPELRAGSYLAGRFAQHVDDWQAAAGFVADALAHDPEDTGLLRRAFLLDLSDGNIEKALPLAKTLAASEPGSSIALLLLFADDAAQGRLEAAAPRLAALAPDGIARYASPLLTAWLIRAGGQPKAAPGAAPGATPEATLESTLAPLATIQGLGVLHALHRAMIAEVGGNRESAAQWYDVVLKSGPPTLRVAQIVGSFLARSGHADQARQLYATFARDNGEGALTDAPALLEQADLGPQPAVTTATDGMAESLFDLASALHQDGSEEMALIYARLALVLRPKFPLTQMLVGDILAARGHFDEALAPYRDIAADRALGWSARLRETDILVRIDRIDEAAIRLEAMAAEHPDRAEPLVRLGDLRRTTKKYSEAIDAYSRALKRIPRLEERHWPILYGRAAAYERQGPWEKSEQDLETALKLSADQAIVLNFLGYSWVDKGVNLARARTMIERAVALRPRDGYIVDSLGWALFRMGDTGGAVARLEQAIELKPLDATINDHLGDAYWAVGRKTEALFQWRRALQNADEPEITESVTKKLKERDRKGAL